MGWVPLLKRVAVWCCSLGSQDRLREQLKELLAVTVWLTAGVISTRGNRVRRNFR